MRLTEVAGNRCELMQQLPAETHSTTVVGPVANEDTDQVCNISLAVRTPQARYLRAWPPAQDIEVAGDNVG
jgi:hypothetical protein